MSVLHHATRIAEIGTASALRGRVRRRIGAFALAGLLALLVGACGAAAPRSETPAATVRAPAGSTASATRTPVATSHPAVAVKVTHTVYGRVLVDGKGRALYLFTRDLTPRSQCYSACATRWPPFLAKGRFTAGVGADARLLGSTRRGDGSTQITYRGHPLYYYIGDRHPGEVLCQNVEEFGGRWYVVTRGGTAVL
jgi:predicted lipoprotein with Yx(FWY)xxD motif